MQIPVPTFPNVETAVGYAAKHQPYQDALRGFAHKDVYARLYGDAAFDAMTRARDAALRGDVLQFRLAGQALSLALAKDAPHVFEQPRPRERR